MAKKLSKNIQIGTETYDVYAEHAINADKATTATHATNASNLVSDNIVKTAADIKKIETDVTNITNGKTTVSKAANADNATTATHAINATTADKVAKSLIISEKKLTVTNEIEYDGSKEVKLDIVPAAGGNFSGRITVPHDNRSAIDNLAVLNYGDIKDKVVSNIINNSLLYTWDNTNLTPTTAGNNLAGISLVTGVEAAVYNFAKSNFNNKDSIPWLGAYLYICSDSNAIYFGTGDSATASRLASSASSITTDGIKRTAKDIQTIEKDIATIENNITSIKDGTIAVDKAKHVSDGVYKMSASDIANSLADMNSEITKIKNGNTVVTKASRAQKANSATNADYATRIGNSTKSYAYDDLQKKITISTSQPSGGSDGDIWIVYNK